MPGQAVATVNDKQWSVDVASTYTELIIGLSGLPSIPAGTGMLFDLGYDQSYIEIDMSQMLFPLDIIFINSTQGVVGVVRNAQPGEEVYFEATTTPGARYFLEVNAGEADGVGAGDSVSITDYQPAGFDLTTVISFAMPLVVLGFVCSLAGGVMTGVMGSSSPKRGELPQVKKVTVWCPICKKEIEVPGYDRISRSEALRRHIETEHRSSGEKIWYLGEWWEEEYSTAECVVYRSADGRKRLYAYWDGTKEVKPAPPRYEAVAYGYRGEILETDEFNYPPTKEILRQWATVLSEKEFGKGLGGFGPGQKMSVDKIIVNGPEGYHVKWSRWDLIGEHHSMWLTPEQRKGLEEKYGAVAVRWAEEAARPGDIKAVEVAAEYFYKKLREALGLGHLSPELSEEQIRKLREVLGLPKEVPPREKGYID